MIGILVALVVAGVLLYLLNTLVPMAAPFKTVINVLVCLFLFLYILQAIGIWSGLPRLR